MKSPKSISRMLFNPDGILFASDWKDSKLYAFTLPDSVGTKTDKPFNLFDLEGALDQAELPADVNLGKLNIEDVAPRPGTDEVYVALSYGKEKTPLLVRVRVTGKLVNECEVKVMDLATLPNTSTDLVDPPSEKLKFWSHVPYQSFTVTAMAWREGRLFVAGLSNHAFASTLRIIHYPFSHGNNKILDVEMYHPDHLQNETRAPIKAMTFIDLPVDPQLPGKKPKGKPKGKKTHADAPNQPKPETKPYLLAAFLCTPIAVISLDDIDATDKNRKEALLNNTPPPPMRTTTIGEFGAGGDPVALIPYQIKDIFNPLGGYKEYVVLASQFRGAMQIEKDQIAESVAKSVGPDAKYAWNPEKTYQLRGIKKPKVNPLNLSNVYRLVDQDFTQLLALRRNLESGNIELVSIMKDYMIRLSDYILEEYWFPDFRYNLNYDWDQMMLKMQNDHRIQQGHPELIRKG